MFCNLCNSPELGHCYQACYYSNVLELNSGWVLSDINQYSLPILMVNRHKMPYYELWTSSQIVYVNMSIYIYIYIYIYVCHKVFLAFHTAMLSLKPMKLDYNLAPGPVCFLPNQWTIIILIWFGLSNFILSPKIVIHFLSTSSGSDLVIP